MKANLNTPAVDPWEGWHGGDEAFVASVAPRGFGTLTATALDAMHFNPVQYVIPGVLPEGLGLLAGKPKFGKSFAALDMLIAVASGGKAFGNIECEAGDALYCAFEDSERRLQDRMRGMLPFGDSIPARLHLETMPMRIGEGLIEALSAWIDTRPAARLIVLDTWRCIKPAPNGRATSSYDEDASGINPLHELAKAHPGLAILIVHHTRKMEADDPFDTISGTHGLTGVADTLIVLAKHGEGAKLAGRSRDMDDYEKALSRDKLTGGWRMVGDARELAKTGERQAILDALNEAEGETLTTSQIARAVGKKQDTVSHLLKRLEAAGHIEKAGYGKYRSNSLSKYSNCSKSDDDDDEGNDDLASLNTMNSLNGG